MAGGIPQTPFEVRRNSLLGFRQEQAVRFIRQREQEGLTVSLREISAALGLDGKGHAWNIVHRLEQRGELVRDESGKRRLRSA